MVLNYVFSFEKGFTDRQGFFEKQLIEVLAENDGCLVVKFFRFLDANHMLNSGVNEDFTRKLRMARGDKYKLKTTRLYYLLELVLTNFVRRTIRVFEHEVAAFTPVVNAMPAKVKAFGLIGQHVHEPRNCSLHLLDLNNVASILQAINRALELLLVV